MYASFFCLASTFFTLARAHPSPFLAANEDMQTWTITRLDYHYMTKESGLGAPHMPWPEGSAFNTTLSFDVQIPDAKAPNGNWNATCEGSWKSEKFEGIEFGCHGQRGGGEDERQGMQSVSFRVLRWDGPTNERLPDSMLEMPFALDVFRGDASTSANEPRKAGNKKISCDGYNKPTSYLTCLVLRPLDGERCKLGSLYSADMSNGKQPKIEAK